MKEEILRRQDIFKSMIERELYNLTLSVEDIESIKGNLMTLYKADVTVLLQKMATECGEIAHENYGGTTFEHLLR